MQNLTAFLLLVAACCVDTILGCSPTRKVDPLEMTAGADVIVVVTAVRTLSSGEAEFVQFRVEEVVKGSPTFGQILELPGSLEDADDFNDRPVPYDFVRPGGRRGSCYATTYRVGAGYLLFLKQMPAGYTANWYALAPTSEQLRYGNDPWLLWVKATVAATDRQGGATWSRRPASSPGPTRYMAVSPTRNSFHVTARLTDPQGHFEVVLWSVTKIADQRSGPVSKSDRHGNGILVTRRFGVTPNEGKGKHPTPFSRTYPVDLFLRPAEQQR